MNGVQNSRYGAIARSLDFSRIGVQSKVFFAVHPSAEHVSSTATGWLTDAQADFPVDKDGVARVSSTIQGAVDLATSGRGDVVLVGPGKWKEEIYIIKMGLKVFGPTVGMGTGYDGARIRPSDASAHFAFTTKLSNANSGACFSVLTRGVEIAGFYFDGGGGYSGIYAGGGLNGCATGYGGTVYTTANASGLYVHDCFFRGGAEGVTGLYLNGPRFGVKIENNYFERWDAAIELDAGNANTENALIQKNVFAAENSGYGIRLYGEANIKTTVIKDNVFADGVGAAFTAGINIPAGATGVTSVVGNFMACAVGMVLTTADYVAGNTLGVAGSATHGSNFYLPSAAGGTEA